MGLAAAINWTALLASSVLLVSSSATLAGTVPGSIPDRAGVSVTGAQRVVASVPAGVLVPSYRNDGYRIISLATIDERSLVEIEIELEPGARTVQHIRFPTEPLAAVPLRQESWGSGDRGRKRASDDPDPLGKLARTLTRRSSTRAEAVQEVLGWVARNIDYELDRAADQEPLAVLNRRSAYCTGIARLSVALLEAVNIEAREVFGYLLEGLAGSPAGYHRWIEVHYPGLGWRFSDPMTSLDFVTAHYLRLDPEGVDSGVATVDEGSDWVIIEEHGAPQPVRSIPRLPVGLQVRDRGGITAGARLSVATETAPERPLRVELAGNGWVRSRTLENRPVYFLDLPLGDYTLLIRDQDQVGELAPAGDSLSRVRVRLDQPVHYQLLVPAWEDWRQRTHSEWLSAPLASGPDQRQSDASDVGDGRPPSDW